jgi:hypothetical protein
MQPGIQYSLQAGTGEIVTNLMTQTCPASTGGSYEGGWRLFFVEE